MVNLSQKGRSTWPEEERAEWACSTDAVLLISPSWHCRPEAPAWPVCTCMRGTELHVEPSLRQLVNGRSS